MVGDKVISWNERDFDANPFAIRDVIIAKKLYESLLLSSCPVIEESP